MIEGPKTNLLEMSRLPDEPTSGQFLVRVLLIVALTLLAHGLVRLVHFLSNWVVRKSAAKRSPVGYVMHPPKFITLTHLVASALTFLIYSVALGFILWVFGLDPKKFLATYLATASVIGLAVGFGCQGLVQDVVTGMTLILSDTLDVGDLIEVSGQIGRVERVGLRFTELTNFFNQQVFVPNRTISNIARYPSSGIDAYVDAQIPEKADRKNASEMFIGIAKGMRGEFNAIILSEPELMETGLASEVPWKFLRMHFKIWPGQGALLETTFRQRVVSAFKAIDGEDVDSQPYSCFRMSDRSGFVNDYDSGSFELLYNRSRAIPSGLYDPDVFVDDCLDE